MRIATFNANSIRTRMDIVLDWMGRHAPDVLCIQETKVQDSEFPWEAITDAGYYVAYSGEKSYNGVAVVSPHPIEGEEAGFDDGGPDDAARLLDVRVCGVRILNTYVPQGRDIEHDMFGYKLEWFRRLRRYLEAHASPRSRLLWLGDLNVARTPLDVHNPQNQAKHVCYHQAVRDAFEKVIDWGFEDLFRQHHADERQYSYFDYRNPNAVTQNRGWRIDYIMATRRLAKRCTDAFIDIEPRTRPRPSDHTFLVADFDV